LLKEKTIEIAKDLLNQRKKEIENKYKLKEELNNLKYDIASILDLRDKNGELKSKMVKENLLKEAILISKLDKNNNLEEKYLILEKYINLVKNDESLNNGIEKVIKYENQIENCKEEIKYIKKEVELEEEEINELENKESNEKEWLKYIENIIKEEIIKFEKEKKEEFLNNQGKEISNTVNNIKEIFPKEEIIKEINK